LADALELLADPERSAMPIAGGTDLVPNMKHRLFEPGDLVALGRIQDLWGIREEGGHLSIGAMESLSSVASDPLVRRHAPSVAKAAGSVAGPQLRNAGTLGGNVCLDTRCTYYNQTRFWRESLGYCLKKDGEVCHVTRVGKKCVAGHSADTPPALMVLGATLDLASPRDTRTLPIRDFFVADGIWNTRRERDELVTRIRIPIAGRPPIAEVVKLRQRNSIDFPLLSIAVAADMEGDRIGDVRGVVTALGARPKELTGWTELVRDQAWSEHLIDALADRAHRQCHPLENSIVDAEWRRAMVRVYVKKALVGLMAGATA
jgi:4-hydroxybenzoyl-CoA reductase subunit beta